VVSYCECGYEPLGFIICGKFLAKELLAFQE
jgi:hypothetical protein